MPDEFDQLLGQINMGNEERRVYFGSSLAALEERYANLEKDVWRAVQLGCDSGEPNRCNSQLQSLARIRAELNQFWTELDSPAPRWDLFHS